MKRRSYGLLMAALVWALAGVQGFPQAQTPEPPPAPEEAPDVTTNADPSAEEAPAMAEDQAEPEETASESPAESRPRRVYRQPVIRFGENVELPKGERAEKVIVLGGNARILGEVQDAVVAVGGSVTMAEGSRAQSVVAVLGRVAVENGAKVTREVVSVGGRVNVAEGGEVGGEVMDMDFGGLLPKVEWLQDWVKYCVFMLRPLSFRVGWVWAVAGIIVLFYALLALIFQKPVRVCVDEINRRPATTFLMGVLTKILVPIIIVLLAATGLGLFIVPFLIAALFLGAIIGKIAILQWLGFSVMRPFWSTSPAVNNPFLALLLGACVVCLIYVVPILGLVAWMVFSLWGLGVAVLAAFGSLKRELPPTTPRPTPSQPIGGYQPTANQPSGEVLACSVQDTFAVPPSSGAAATSFAGAGGTPEQGSFAASAADATNTTTPGTAAAGAFSNPAGGAQTSGALPPLMPEALAFPRAGFWERMAAGFLDIVLVSILGHLVGGAPLGFLVALAYFAGIWAWRSTTIGGIVIGLKVVRQDGQELTFPVALVRALGAAFSIVVLFLGFLNITWDKEKQAWHDRIAGTVVLKLPRGTPLLMV